MDLSPTIDHLAEGEKEALEYLLEVGSIMHQLYLDPLHPEASRSLEELAHATGEGLSEERVQLLRDLYWLSKGPIATTLDNKRVPFLPVAAEVKGKNVYPWGITKEEIDLFVTANPKPAKSIHHIRHIVRRNTQENINRDLETLERFPVLAELHPGLKERLHALRVESSALSLYGLPYSVAYAPELIRAHHLLHKAADAIDDDDSAFARFLRNRARDFLTDDYESGDASWVTGRFKNLNAQIGSYETYDDALYGAKTFFSLVIFVRDVEKSTELSETLSGIQNLEDSLPYESSRKIDDDIPVGVYDVLADFGQSRGANTATILPNEGYLTTQYGRTILVRGNILSNSDAFAERKIAFAAATDPVHHDDLSPEGILYYVFWHEVGHYLGPVDTADGRPVRDALGQALNPLEEMKSDLISLYSVPYMLKTGLYDVGTAQSIYATGVRRVLLKNRPRRDQNYGTMQLIQFNWFIEHGLLAFDVENRTLKIDYAKYDEVVEGLLAKVLTLQSAGSESEAEQFIERYTYWDDSVNGIIAARMRESEKYRFTLVTYETLKDAPRQPGRKSSASRTTASGRK
jgi:hypothetical protein